MEVICEKDKCTGCSACYNICKHEAINMLPDELGFVHPVIDIDKCVDCGLCRKNCPVNHLQPLLYPQECYAASLMSDNELKQCASGGAATAFARCIIRKGGIVYGCSGEDVFNIQHIRIQSLTEIEKLMGSKYVQSKIGYIYQLVLDDLKKERLVLFIGTPCQIAGLKAFLHKDYECLLTVDLVCHGVPSQKMLNENIAYYISEKDGKNIKIAFRRKAFEQESLTKFNSQRIEFGWFLRNQPYSCISKKFFKDSYMFGFLQCLTFRESCYTCRYATSARVSDITIADFWGLGDDAGFEKGKGVSVCLVNTERGKQFFSAVESSMKVVQREVVEAIMGNGQLQYPSKKHKNHIKFRKLYPQLGLKKTIKQCLKREKFQYEVVMVVKQYIKRIIK